MKQTSAAYQAAIKAISRTIHITVTNNGAEIPLTDMQSVKINKIGASAQTLKPGELCKSKAEIVIDHPITGTVDISFTVEGASDIINVGRYWINSVDYDATKKNYTVTAYDLPPWFEEEALPISTAVSDILTLIENSTGMTISDKSLITLTEIPSQLEEGMTWLTLLRYIVGYSGYSIRTSEGNLELYRYADTGVSFPRSRVYQNGLTTSDLTHIYYYLVNEKYTSGGGAYGIKYMNPFITSDEQVSAMACYIGAEYSPLQAVVQSDPSIDIGDIVSVGDAEGNTFTAYVMEIVLEYDGGLKMGIKSYSDMTVRSVVSERPIDRKLKDIQTYTQSNIEKIMDSLFLSPDGYYFLIDSNGDPVTTDTQVPAGFQITDSSMTQGWRFILGGLYHSKDAFATIDKTAITADGYIMGDTIMANTISTESLEVSAQTAVHGTNKYITFGDGEINIGEKDANGNIVSQYSARFTKLGMRVMSQSNRVTLLAEGDTVEAANLTAKNFSRVTTDVTQTGTTNVFHISGRTQGIWSNVHNCPAIGTFWEGE